ncbi:MAG: hypothetical protein DRP41_06295, partial [Thermodesulfobacteriota bacterium]
MLNTPFEEKVREIIREEISKALDDFLIKLRLELIPFVSEEEQKEIEELYGEELLEDDEKDTIVTR